jgi:hypothetical protein
VTQQPNTTEPWCRYTQTCLLRRQRIYDLIYSTFKDYVAELMRAFRDAGLDAEFDPNGLTDRGLYVARIAA